MAKTATMMDQGILPVSGRWTWKEDNTGQTGGSLEFSPNAGGDKQDKRKRGKGLLPDHAGKRNDRAASGVGNRTYGVGRGKNQGIGHSKSPRPQIKQTTDHTAVTLDDIKSVALEMMSEVEGISGSFESLFHTEPLDDFLLDLLRYFHYFFDKETLQNKPQDMYIEPSLSDKQAYAEVCARLDGVQKLLGKSYCILVLGLGLEDHHHMACGFSRVSATVKDRNMYETFYSFCTFVVWITFRRREYEIVKKEIGRMLRSDTFNPAIRVKNAPEEPKHTVQPSAGAEADQPGQDETKEPAPKKLTAAEYRRLHGKRPAIKSIINQRSPAIVSILPSPKEEAHWLFRRHRPISHNSLDVDADLPETEDEILQGLTTERKQFKVGILGEPLNMFNPMLTPLGAENEDEEHDGEDSTDKQGEEGAGSNKSPPAERASRQQTAISHTTTEAYDEDD